MKPSSHRETHAGMAHFGRQSQSDSCREIGTSLVGSGITSGDGLTCLNAWLRMSGIIWRCGLVVVGVTLLEEVSYSGNGL